MKQKTACLADKILLVCSCRINYWHLWLVIRAGYFYHFATASRVLIPVVCLIVCDTGCWLIEQRFYIPLDTVEVVRNALPSQSLD